MTTPPNPREALRARVIGTLTHYLSQCEREHTARTDQAELRELIAALAAQPPAVSVDEAMVRRATKAYYEAHTNGVGTFDVAIRAALTAALHPTQDAAHGGRG